MQVAVLSRTWWSGDEAAFVLRSIAGGLSRLVDVTVFASGPATSIRPDGLFDVRCIGEGAEAHTWPASTAAFLPASIDLILIDATDPSTVDFAANCSVTLGRSQRIVTVGPNRQIDPAMVGLSVFVNPLASALPHNGFGFTDYVLVLTDQPDIDHPVTGTLDSGLARWLIARFPRPRTVVIEGADALAYWGRCLRGVVHVDTRTDLQRLIAHARVTVDLHPGRLIARECVESLQLGTPIAAPRGSVGAQLASLGGGAIYSNVAELLACANRFQNAEYRARVATRGSEVARNRFGDSERFIARLGKTLGLASR